MSGKYHFRMNFFNGIILWRSVCNDGFTFPTSPPIGTRDPEKGSDILALCDPTVSWIRKHFIPKTKWNWSLAVINAATGFLRKTLHFWLITIELRNWLMDNLLWSIFKQNVKYLDMYPIRNIQNLFWGVYK